MPAKPSYLISMKAKSATTMIWHDGITPVGKRKYSQKVTFLDPYYFMRIPSRSSRSIAALWWSHKCELLLQVERKGSDWAE